MKYVAYLLLMLVIMGERWEIAGNFVTMCQGTGFSAICNGNYYRRVYVIGEANVVPTEKFTIPVPNAQTRQLSKEDAYMLNRELGWEK